MRQIPLELRLSDRAVFASFLPARNTEALEHARRIAAGEAGGLTWLCGPTGAGKTHLLQAICAAASERDRAGYLPLRQVAQLGVGVLEGMPQLGCLCVDDIDQVAGQPEWEHALFGVLREIVRSDEHTVCARRSIADVQRQRPGQNTGERPHRLKRETTIGKQ